MGLPGSLSRAGREGSERQGAGRAGRPFFKGPLGGRPWPSFCLITQEAALIPTSEEPSSPGGRGRCRFPAPPTSWTRVFDDPAWSRNEKTSESVLESGARGELGRGRRGVWLCFPRGRSHSRGARKPPVPLHTWARSGGGRKLVTLGNAT